MYIRWKHRQGTRQTWSAATPNGEKGCKDTLSAVLVQNTRVHGKPRQRVVKYLGSVQATRTRCPYAQRDFWNKVTPQLDALTLDAAMRARVEAALRALRQAL